jgi:multimeric flavodoxin WrbA
MKVVAINGSARKKGNSATLINRFLDRAKALGHETEKCHLNDYNPRGCQACMACKAEGAVMCVIEDGLKALYESMMTADVVVFATPVYFGAASAQFKAFIDRHFGFMDAEYNVRFPAGKKGLFIVAQGAPDEKLFKDVFEKCEGWMKGSFGYEELRLVRVLGTRGPDEATERAELLDEIDRHATEMLS